MSIQQSLWGFKSLILEKKNIKHLLVDNFDLKTFKRIENKIMRLKEIIEENNVEYTILNPINPNCLTLILSGKIKFNDKQYEFKCIYTRNQWRIITLNNYKDLANKNLEIIIKFICYSHCNPVANDNSQFDFINKIFQ